MNQRTNSGFILPVTLWVIVAAMVAVSYADVWNDQYIDQAIVEQDKFDQRLQMDALIAVLRFNLNKNRMTRTGLPIDGLDVDIAVDGRVYDAGNGLILFGTTNPTVIILIMKISKPTDIGFVVHTCHA